MALDFFTLVHIMISLGGIAAGFGALAEWIAGRLAPRWTAAYLGLTILTSATGFFFPWKGFTPAVITGVISLVVLAVACWSLYGAKLAGWWRRTFVISAVAALYLNFFVLVAQMFQKMPALIKLAPTQSEPAFAVTQGVVLLVFIALGVFAARSRLA